MPPKVGYIQKGNNVLLGEVKKNLKKLGLFFLKGNLATAAAVVAANYPQDERSEFCFAKLFQSLWFWLLLTSKVAPAEGGTKGCAGIRVCAAQRTKRTPPHKQHSPPPTLSGHPCPVSNHRLLPALATNSPPDCLLNASRP